MELDTLGELRLYGPPGCGKTHALKQQVKFNAERYGSEALLVVSHTNAAAAEIAGRELPIDRRQVSTLHSVAFRSLDRPPFIQDTEHLAEFSENYPQWALTGSRNPEEYETREASYAAPGDELMAETSRLRNLMADPALWPASVRAFHLAWEDYKKQVGGIDFTDMLTLALENVNYAPGCPRCMIVDEAQDSSPLQMALIWKWGKQAERIILALDPDQSIYSFAGCDPTVFMRTQAAKEHTLSQSHRLPARVHAEALKWIRKIKNRVDREFLPRTEEGFLLRLQSTWRTPDKLLGQIRRFQEEGKRMMFIASCGYMLDPLIELLRAEGLTFQNQYRRSNGRWNPLLRRGDNSSTAVDRLLLYLLPTDPGERFWNRDELLMWLEMTKDVLKRGAKKTIEYCPEVLGDKAVNVMLNALKCPEDLEQILGPGTQPLEWLEGRLAARWKRSASYAIEVATKSGRQALEEEPLITVGTIHSVKGGEADVVFLFPDLSLQGWNEDQHSVAGHEAMIRLYYVALTRAREGVFLCDAASSMAAPL